MSSVPETHAAVVTPAARAPLEIKTLPTVPPRGREVLVRNEWTASTPLDLHQADGGLLVKHPQVLGDGVAGEVEAIGDEVKNLEIGDKVFGFTWRVEKEKAYQEYVTAPEYLFGKLPSNTTAQAAVTLPNNFVTVFHAVTVNLHLSLPWPKPNNYEPEHADTPLLIWGGSSSVGQYALQILQWYGYRNLITTASKKHHAMLKEIGASQCFDYREEGVADRIKTSTSRPVRFILDCIGSKDGSLAHIADIAEAGSIVAALLPVIVKDASETEAPEYAMDVAASADWQQGVETSGVRTHFYLDNELFKEHLQPTIMPMMLEQGIVKPNAQKIIDGNTLLERAQKAIDTLRRKEVSGERLVWRVAE